MLLNIGLASLMLIVTSGIHAGGMLLVSSLFQVEVHRQIKYLRVFRVLRISSVVIMMFLASCLEALVWAGMYLALNAMEGFEKALYFSMVTYSTLGYGDVVLHDRWRLLSAFESANGIIMFGWTTAIVIAAVQRVYSFGDKKDR